MIDAPDGKYPCIEIKILHPQFNAFKKTKNATVQQVDKRPYGWERCFKTDSISF